MKTPEGILMTDEEWDAAISEEVGCHIADTIYGMSGVAQTEAQMVGVCESILRVVADLMAVAVDDKSPEDWQMISRRFVDHVQYAKQQEKIEDMNGRMAE